ncbi:hypothetical protein BH23GEM9_BH23GEM9_26210 [soil metagenome]
MNLIGFHRVLIAAAILFFVGYGIWEAVRFLQDRTVLRLVFAVGSFTAAAVLLLYLRRLRSFLNLRD